MNLNRAIIVLMTMAFVEEFFFSNQTHHESEFKIDCALCDWLGYEYGDHLIKEGVACNDFIRHHSSSDRRCLWADFNWQFVNKSIVMFQFV